MGLHYVNWMSTCSGLEDENIHKEALNWLVGESDITKSEQTTSYSGSKIHLVSANVKNKGKATKSITRTRMIKSVHDCPTMPACGKCDKCYDFIEAAAAIERTQYSTFDISHIFEKFPNLNHDSLADILWRET